MGVTEKTGRYLKDSPFIRTLNLTSPIRRFSIDQVNNALVGGNISYADIFAKSGEPLLIPAGHIEFVDLLNQLSNEKVDFLIDQIMNQICIPWWREGTAGKNAFDMSFAYRIKVLVNRVVFIDHDDSTPENEFNLAVYRNIRNSNLLYAIEYLEKISLEWGISFKWIIGAPDNVSVYGFRPRVEHAHMIYSLLPKARQRLVFEVVKATEGGQEHA